MQNLTNLKIFKYDVIDGNGGLEPLILFYLITSAKRKLSNWFLNCYNNGSVMMTSYEKEVFVIFWGLMGVKTLNSRDLLSLDRFAVKKHGNIGVQKPSTV